MKKLKNKKGFTIVELVIVIAVIAILAAVLIPTFSGVIKKANTSKDIQTARNMNTAIQIHTVTDEINTISDVMYVLADAGLNPDSASDGNKFMWDAENKRIILVDAENNVLNFEGYIDTDINEWLSLDYQEQPLENNSSSYEDLFN